jgi:hypothetical protein
VNEHAITPEALRASISRAQDQRDRAYRELEAAERELEWLRRGLDLLGGPGREEEAGDDALRALLPGMAKPDRPTLRQALVLVMRSNPHKQWPVDDLASMLHMNNWLPKRLEPGKRITDAAHGLVNDGYLVRANRRGTYELAPYVAEALKRWFPPTTDYTMANEWRISAPDHPAAGPGLADDE